MSDQAGRQAGRQGWQSIDGTFTAGRQTRGAAGGAAAGVTAGMTRAHHQPLANQVLAVHGLVLCEDAEEVGPGLVHQRLLQ